ncbi:hypothetical protein IAT38_001568 [Cryptococcus sp. DSM 104549]
MSQPPTDPNNPAAGSSSGAALPPTLSAAMSRSTTAASGSTGPISARSTPAPGDGTPGVIQKLKFKPKVPIRRRQPEPEVKAEPVAPPAVRGGMRGRGRGGPTRGRGRGAAVSSSTAAGVFGGPRPVAAASSSRRFAPAAAPRNMEITDAEVYSDHSDEEGVTSARPIDIDLVSTMSESAPTSLFRDRRLAGGKAKGSAKAEKDKAKKEKDAKRKGKSRADAMDVDAKPDVRRAARSGVKDEPVSPETTRRVLREDDAMISDDEEQDRDERGRRVRNFMQTGGTEEAEEVNAAQAVDLSDSESEDEEETMEGDFVKADGFDEPEKKLFIFQFPQLFPKYDAPGPVDLTGPSTLAEVKPDVKPTAAQLRGKKLVEPTPEGRVGTMVVMKSGKVKMVMGDDIVMNVTPGVPATFVQHLVHLDPKKKAAMVLGEVHKNYVVTPDIDRLLQELYVSGGKTPGDRLVEQRERMAGAPKGLVKMEVD